MSEQTEPVVFVRVDTTRLIDGQMERRVEFGIERDGKFVSNEQLEAERLQKESESGLPGPDKHAKGGRL